MDVNQILRLYSKRIRDSDALRKIAANAKTYKAAQGYAAKVAEIFCDLGIDVPGYTSDELAQVIVEAMRTDHAEVARICRKVQSEINAAIGIGMNPIEPEFNAERARGIATAVSDMAEFTPDYFRSLIENFSRSIVDDSIAENARAQRAAGLVTRIVRVYDDVGLHGGKEPCQWCLDRQGEWDDYYEAKNAGAFERHPGCKCYIEYHVKKTHTWSNATGKWINM